MTIKECPECKGGITVSHIIAPWGEIVELVTCSRCGAEYYHFPFNDWRIDA